MPPPATFAAAIVDAAMQVEYVATSFDPTATALPMATITAYSPVTQQSYGLKCRISSAGATLACESPTDGQVGADFLTQGGTWHSLVNFAG